MKILKIILFIFLILLLNKIANSNSLIIKKNIFYSDKKDYLQSLDIYYKKNFINSPVLIFIHGGAWKYGNKNKHLKKALYSANKGFIFITINYRLYPNVKFPIFVNDVANAVKWVYNNIYKYSGNNKQIIIMGHSAGAHLAALIGYGNFINYNILKSIKGIILLDSAAYDLIYLKNNFRFYFNIIIKPVFGEDLNTLKKASPIYYIGTNKYIPPTMIIYTKRKQSIKEAQKLKISLIKAGAYVITYQAFDKTHKKLNKDLGKLNDKITEEICKFLNNIIRRQK